MYRAVRRVRYSTDDNGNYVADYYYDYEYIWDHEHDNYTRNASGTPGRNESGAQDPQENSAEPKG